MNAGTEQALGRLERPARAVAFVFVALTILAAIFTPFAQDKLAFFADRMVFATLFSFTSVGVLLAPEPLRTRYLRCLGWVMVLYFPGVCIVLLLCVMLQLPNIFLLVAPHAFDWLLPGALAISSPVAVYGWWRRFVREGRVSTILGKN